MSQAEDGGADIAPPRMSAATDPPAPPEEPARQLRARIAAARHPGSGPGQSLEPPPAERLAAALERAAQVADAGTTLPSLQHLSGPRRVVARALGRLALYVLRLISVEQQQFNHLLLRAVRALADGLAAADARAAAATRQTQRLTTEEEEQRDQLAALTNELTALRRELAARHDELAALHQQVRSVADGVRERDRWFAGLDARDAAHDARDAEHEARDAAHDARDAAHDAMLVELRATAAFLRGQIADRDARIDALLAAVGAAPAAAPTPPPVAAVPEPVIDAWEFSRLTRGDEDTARQRLAAYVPLFAGAAEVLDLGCGRGEFLDLLRDAGIAARGVDLSNDMVLRCLEKRLDVVKADALAHLAAQPDAGLGGVFACQLIEHLPAAAQIALVQLAYRKLRPGGVLVVETLNPECLMVHLRWFWMDLTHVRLMHPETLKFLLLTTGFANLEGRMDPGASAAPGGAATPGDVAPDYAMIARR